MDSQRRGNTRVREEAFGWYSGLPPTPEQAVRHFAEKAKRDPENRSLYEDALRLFITSCWNIYPPDPPAQNRSS